MYKRQTYYRGVGEEQALAAANLWAEMFADDSTAHVASAVKALIATDEKGYPPSIGAVKAQLRKITQPPSMAPVEAWGLVWRAIQRSGYNSREEFEKLPPTLRRLVGSSDQLKAWSMMDAGTVQSVIASNFQRSYQTRAKQEEEFQALPSDIKTMAPSQILRYRICISLLSLFYSYRIIELGRPIFYFLSPYLSLYKHKTF